MNREILLEQHMIEAWGLLWVQWQKDTKDRLRKHAQQNTMSDRVNRFAELHLSLANSKSLRRDSTSSSGTNLPS